MNHPILASLTVLGAAAASVFAGPTVGWDGVELADLVVSADRMAADNTTGALVASGHVHAVAGPVSLLSELLVKDGDEYVFSEPTSVTTCTNDSGRCHWAAAGGIVYRDGEGVLAKNVTVRLWEIPVFWIPFWYYPIDTDYGLRVMPGYTSRWGGYVMTKYVYRIAGGFGPGEFGLSGSTKVDWRAENGVAVGQGLRWQLGEFGRGRFRAYYAWDEDADRYDRHWTEERKWHYENWGSTVPDRRWAVELEHRWEMTERDTLRLKGAVYSDSHFRGDFLRDGHFGQSNRFSGYDGNELAWEHVENPFGVGVSVSGPLNEFHSGVARLPEVYVDIAPQPLFGSPLAYESANRIGWLDRNYSKYGRSDTHPAFRYGPGEWADYQTFRFDTYHRLTASFRIADVVSVTPRVGGRGTYWDDTGRQNLTGGGRIDKTGDGTWRLIAEGGLTVSARGVAELGGGWQHIVEPYADFLAQEAHYTGFGGSKRQLVFDSIDTSSDWLDTFAGRSRNLPYTWYGVTPGLRNALRMEDASGAPRTLLDFDLYAAVQLNDTEWTEGGRYHRLPRHASDPNWGKSRGQVAPGFRVRWFPSRDSALLSRVEYDTERGEVAYAELCWRQTLSKSFKYGLSYFGRNHRWWDFSSSPYDAEALRNEDFNWVRFSYFELELEHELCDALAWGPFIRWDFREEELDEVGGWLDLRTDCLGFRFSLSYENDYERLDRSKSDDDWRFGFYIYLRALGPMNGSPF